MRARVRRVNIGFDTANGPRRFSARAFCPSRLSTMPRVAPVAAAVAALAAVAAAFGPNCKPIETAVLRGEPVYDGPLVPNLKVAFLGDTGNGEENLEVFQMVKTWGAEAVFHAGDSSYDNDPDAFWGDVDEVFGTTFPYFFVIGYAPLCTWAKDTVRNPSGLTRACSNPRHLSCTAADQQPRQPEMGAPRGADH